MHAPHDSLILDLPDEAATLALGARLAHCLAPGMTVYLEGGLGAGKTTLVRGLLRALGYAGRVKSPTYTLVESYAFSGFIVYHYDLYRMHDPREWEDAGFRDDVGEHALRLVEWPEKGRGRLPPADLRVTLESAGDARRAHLAALSEKGKICLDDSAR